MAEEANALLAGNNEACSDRRSGKDECGNGEGTRTEDRSTPRRDPYAMEVDRGRNCYTCRRFGHMAHHCRNRRRVAEGRRLEFKGNYEHSNSLKEEENLEFLN